MAPSSGNGQGQGGPGWYGLTQQSPLAVQTDYFDNNSLDPKWLEWDVPGTQTVTENAQGLTLSQPSVAGDSNTGIYQTAPADNQFLITAYIDIEGITANFIGLSAFAGENVTAAPATASFLVSTIGAGGTGPYVSFDRWTAYNTFDIIINGFRPVVYRTSIYARLFIDRTAVTATCLFSDNGHTWVQHGAAVSWAAGAVSSIDSIGLLVNNAGSGATAKLKSLMFRVDITADPFLPIGARA
jgi:hypothetical protein